MSEPIDITETEIRAHVLERAKRFAAATGRSLSSISEEAVRDSKFLANVERGSNFTVRTYQRVLDWLVEQEKSLPPPEPPGQPEAVMAVAS